MRLALSTPKKVLLCPLARCAGRAPFYRIGRGDPYRAQARRFESEYVKVFDRPGKDGPSLALEPYGIRGDNVELEDRMRELAQSQVQETSSENIKSRLDEWTELLENTLPGSLRTNAPELPARVSSLTTRDLLRVHRRVRAITGQSLLAHLGIEQGRLNAMMYLVERLIRAGIPSDLQSTRTDQLPMTLSYGNETTLEECTLSASECRPRTPANRSLDVLLGAVIQEKHRRLPTGKASHEARGEIWRMLGDMLLRAQDTTGSISTRNNLTACFLYILGRMHHRGAVPDSLYNYDTSYSAKPFARPPTLYLLSRQILNTISDTAWKVHWQEESERARSYGYELPETRLQPHLTAVNPEIWLELILWACVEDGHFDQAADIIRQIEPGKSGNGARDANETFENASDGLAVEVESGQQQWNVISWPQIRDKGQSELGVMASIRSQLDKSRINHMAGFELASGGSSLVDPGSRTISQEVVLAIMDGLANNTYGDGDQTANSFDRFGRAAGQMRACKRLLQRNPKGVSQEHMVDLAFRGLDPSTIANATTDHWLKPSSAALTSMLHFVARPTGVVPAATPELDLRSALLGLSFWDLECSAIQSRLVPVMKTVKFIQRWIDDAREDHLRMYRDSVTAFMYQQSDSWSESRLLTGEGPAIPPFLPMSTVDALLQRCVDWKQQKFSDWLLFNKDIDGGLMDPFMLAEPQLFPTFLRFAEASGNQAFSEEILNRIINSGLAKHFSRELLHYQLRYGTAEVAEKILERGSLQQSNQENDVTDASSPPRWAPSEAMAIAATILRIEKSQRNPTRWIKLLQDFLEGKYHALRDMRSDRNTLLHLVQTHNQLLRILRSVTDSPSLQTSLGQIRIGLSGGSSRSSQFVDQRAHYPVAIAARDFQILLEAVFRSHGIDAAVALWNKWVRPRPDIVLPKRVTTDRDDGRDVRRAGGGGGDDGNERQPDIDMDVENNDMDRIPSHDGSSRPHQDQRHPKSSSNSNFPDNIDFTDDERVVDPTQALLQSFKDELAREELRLHRQGRGKQRKKEKRRRQGVDDEAEEFK